MEEALSGGARILDPTITDPSITPVERTGLGRVDPGHYVAAPVPSAARGRLLLLFPGTNAPGRGLREWADCAAAEGYHALSLDYVNTVLVASLQTSDDPQVFARFRELVMFGGWTMQLPTGAALSVAAPDGVMNRLRKALVYLAAVRPEEGWGAYLSSGDVRWTAVTAMGHSQGSGIAVALGQEHALEKVVISGGPQDYVDAAHRPAAWLERPSATPRERYLAFLGVHDEHDINKQLPGAALVMNATPREIAFVVEATPEAFAPGSPPRLLVTTKTLAAAEVDHTLPGKEGDLPIYHQSLVHRRYARVWSYLLRWPFDAPAAAVHA